jgi:hypothetical protein
MIGRDVRQRQIAAGCKSGNDALDTAVRIVVGGDEVHDGGAEHPQWSAEFQPPVQVEGYQQGRWVTQS